MTPACGNDTCLCTADNVRITGQFFRIIFREQESKDRAWIPRQEPTD